MTTSPHLASPWFFALGIAVSAAAGCQLAIGLTDYDIVAGDGGAGGATACVHANDCATLVASDCEQPACVNGVCELTSADEATPCAQGYCAADGSCVDCTDDSHCPDDGESCGADHTCVPCADGQQNGRETDADCGGPDCAPCDNGLTCERPTDCTSRFCAVGSCSSCKDAGDCGSGMHCDAGVCLEKHALGTACTQSIACQSGHCADGVCCDASCDDDCQQCSTDGACLPVDTGPDPDSCAGDGTCAAGRCLIADGAPCIVSVSCGSGKCRDNVCCTSDCDGVCEACDVAGMLGTCTAIGYPQADPDTCTGTLSCSILNTCELDDGQPCPNGNEDCASANCVTGTCTAP